MKDKNDVSTPSNRPSSNPPAAGTKPTPETKRHVSTSPGPRESKPEAAEKPKPDNEKLAVLRQPLFKSSTNAQKPNPDKKKLSFGPLGRSSSTPAGPAEKPLPGKKKLSFAPLGQPSSIPPAAAELPNPEDQPDTSLPSDPPPPEPPAAVKAPKPWEPKHVSAVPEKSPSEPPTPVNNEQEPVAPEPIPPPPEPLTPVNNEQEAVAPEPAPPPPEPLPTVNNEQAPAAPEPVPPPPEPPAPVNYEQEVAAPEPVPPPPEPPPSVMEEQAVAAPAVGGPSYQALQAVMNPSPTPPTTIGPAAVLPYYDSQQYPALNSTPADPAGLPESPDESFDDEPPTVRSSSPAARFFLVFGVLLVIGLASVGVWLWQRTQQLQKVAEETAAAAKRSAEEVSNLKAEAEKVQQEQEEERKKRRWFIEGCGDSPTEKGGAMCAVPSGLFWRGCNESVDRECDDDEKPYRQLFLDAYYMDRHEVTVEEYKKCVDENQCKADGLKMTFWDKKKQPKWAWACNWGKSGREDHPVNCIEWGDASDYCKWAGKRLPTEAEWEKAARGADGRKYPWGNSGFDVERLVGNIADESVKEHQPDWARVEGYNDSYYATAPVETYPRGRSPYGLFDMIGNVWEWASDKYVPEYYADAPSKNPRGPESKEDVHVMRGTSWSSPPSLSRASARDGNESKERFEFAGFRCALSSPTEF